ncbi:MAG: hypothetical protein PF961_21755 [Planctomycetota bacterium]|nr:hypothetical protein [Planctomycetota bacterium]
MRLFINSDFHSYLDRCWPLMPVDWSVAATSTDFVEVELDPDDLDELLRYMSMDLRYSESDDDARDQVLAHAMHAFVLAQLQMQDADVMPFPRQMG